MIVSPSLLAADFANLERDINSIPDADWLHFDVMDGVFVDNISFGIPVLESVRRVTDKPLDVHLMITEPQKHVEKFCKAGANLVTIHAEACSDPRDIRRSIDMIHNLGCYAGLAIKPATAYEAALPFLMSLDLILVMTVEPGKGGQAFMSDMTVKMQFLRHVIEERRNAAHIQVDGGINPETAAICRRAGADVLVAGSDVFKQADRNARIAQLRNAV